MTVPYITLINILLEREAVPEFQQYDAHAGNSGGGGGTAVPRRRRARGADRTP